MEGMQRRLNDEIESHELIGTFYFDLSRSPLPPPLYKAYFLLSVDAFLPLCRENGIERGFRVSFQLSASAWQRKCTLKEAEAVDSMR